MGMMTKLRDRTGVVLWILVISFGVIWVLQDSGALDVVGTGGSPNVAVVDGEPITYDEYAQAVNAQMEQFQQRSGESMPPQMVEQLRETVYRELVDNKIREREMDRLGIKVTDEEVYDMVMGENPHPIIRVYFGDGQGGVNRALLQNFIQNPEARADWLQIEDYLRSERRRQKLDELLEATVHVTQEDVEAEYMRQNKRVTAQWVGLRFSDVPDAQVQVTDSDLQSFYRENREDYARERTYTVEYVLLSKRPTAEDSARVAEELTRLKPRFAAAEGDSTFLASNASERPYSNAWFGPSELDPEIASAVFDGSVQAGEIVGPVFGGNMGHLVKVVDVRSGDATSVRARHILIRADGGEEQALQRAEEVKRQLESGADFATLARQQSQDPGSAQRGGDLGWFGPGEMVEPFEQAAFDAPIGSVVGPVKTDFGYHLIRVESRANQEVRVADYALGVRTDVGTLNALQEQLEDLRYYAEETDATFAGEAQRLGMNVQTMQVEEGQEVLPDPNIGMSRSLMNFLEGAEEGAISEVIELNNSFLVARVQEVTPAGYRPFEEVRAEIEPQVLKQKKLAVQADRLQQALAQSSGFDGLASAVGQPVQTADNLTFDQVVVPGLGREPKFTGTAFGLSEGATSRVITGENAAYVLRVTSVQEPEALTDAERDQIRRRLQAMRRNEVKQRWIEQLRDRADVQDNRRLFQM